LVGELARPTRDTLSIHARLYLWISGHMHQRQEPGGYPLSTSEQKFTRTGRVVDVYRTRAGARPQPFPPPLGHNCKHKYKLIPLYNKSQMRANWLARPTQGVIPYERSRGQNL
jgi:hypothetical protein